MKNKQKKNNKNKMMMMQIVMINGLLMKTKMKTIKKKKIKNDLYIYNTEII